ncbi:MAG: uracil-DNA glycosylase [Saprospiraceae bacterium]|nr:uracil-DNA glycosylase [Saprospiraceae bacterium]
MNNVNIETSWKAILKEEFEKEYFKNLSQFLKAEIAQGKIIYPPGKLIFNAFNSCSFTKLKVVILGQDPYHGPGEAMGLSFSVPKGIAIPPSLHNIFKELNRSYGYGIPKNGDLSTWAHQGVLLLNASLTVAHKSPNSHKNSGWHQFTDAVISLISEHKQHVVFMLWGNFAKSKRGLIDPSKHLILESAHPSPLAGTAFSGNDHFAKANTYLESNGIQPIDWKIEAAI